MAAGRADRKFVVLDAEPTDMDAYAGDRAYLDGRLKRAVREQRAWFPGEPW